MKKNSQIIKIKKATHKDIGLFWDLFKVSVKKQFPEYPIKARNLFLKKYYTKNNLKQLVKNKTITLLIAIDNNEIIGYLIANSPYGGVSSIIWLAVKDSSQNKGIGSNLLKKYEAIAKKQGIHKILLLITDKQRSKFYKKNGYKLVGYIPQSYFGVDDWWFYKEIQTPKY
ncbi:GNAT family N-acetyltransferase [Candidatus Parcubacteria bacterium]|nr:GNAT family N-acetyltransferase [Candidatus Parcubacteria bacterium]